MPLNQLDPIRQNLESMLQRLKTYKHELVPQEAHPSMDEAINHTRLALVAVHTAMSTTATVRAEQLSRD